MKNKRPIILAAVIAVSMFLVAIGLQEFQTPYETPDEPPVSSGRSQTDQHIDSENNVINVKYITIRDEEFRDDTTFLSLTHMDNLTAEEFALLANFYNLNHLNLQNSQISDFTPLTGLINLRRLTLYNSQISDLTSLAGLTNLEYLNLQNNQISDLTPLAGLANLRTLALNDNRISDLAPLSGLEN